MVTVSPAAWAAMAEAGAPSPSNLSLLDLRRNWLETGRGVVPGMPSALEFWALDAAVAALETEGLKARIDRHAQAKRASLAALGAAGLAPWVAAPDRASNLATAAPVPPGIDADQLVARAAMLGVPLTPGFGDVRGKLVRLDHTGARAAFVPVLANLAAYLTALRDLGHPADLGAAAAAVAAVYGNSP
jgi:aspartate aminotransferase-like enzyme